MANVTTAIGLVEHAAVTGGAESKNGLGDAISETVGFEFANAETYDPDTSWKPADADPANTRVLYTLDERVPVSAVAVPIAGMDDVDDAVRVRWAKRWAEKLCAPNVLGTTADGGITETASWTFSWCGRLDPAELTVDRSFAEARITGASSNNTRLVLLAVRDGGFLGVWIPRMSGTPNVLTTASRIDDCQPHWIDVSFVDAGGSGGTATVYLDGVVVGTNTITDVFGSNSIRLALGFHFTGLLELWDRALTADELAIHRYRIKTGAIDGLEAGLMFTATDAATPTTVADISGNGHTMTLPAGTWSTITNPGMDHNPAAQPRHQAWRKRPSLKCVSAGAGTVATTSAATATTPLFTGGFWFRSKSVTAASFPVQLWGANSIGNNQFRIRQKADGTLALKADRYTSDATPVATTTNVTNGEWHAITYGVGWADEASIGVGGVEEASVTAPAYTGSTGIDFTLHHGSEDFELAGPVFLTAVPMSHADAYAILVGQAHAIPGPSTSPGMPFFWSLDEGTGTTISNALGTDEESDGDLTVTSAAASWIANGITNPAPGPMRDPSERFSQTFWESTAGLSPETDEILLEMKSGSVPQVYAIMPFDAEWPEYGFGGGTDVDSGPQLTILPGRGIQGSSAVAGREVGYAMPLLTIAEQGEIRQHVARASQTWTAAGQRAGKPIALINLVSDRRDWPETCVVVQPRSPRASKNALAQTAIVAGVRYSRALLIVGPELFGNLG